MSGRYRRDGWTYDVMIRICRHRLISMKGSSVNVKNRQQNKQIQYRGRGGIAMDLHTNFECHR